MGHYVCSCIHYGYIIWSLGTGSGGITLYNGHCQQNITLYRPHTTPLRAAKIMSKNLISFFVKVGVGFLFTKKSIDRSQNLCVFIPFYCDTERNCHTRSFVRPPGVPAGVGRRNGRIKSQSGYQTELTKDVSGQMSGCDKFIGNVPQRAGM